MAYWPRRAGSLSIPGGRIDVAWESANALDGELMLHWRESGGLRVEPPRHFGFGMTHVRGSVEHQLGGELNLNWRSEGLECELTLPSRQLVRGSD